MKIIMIVHFKEIANVNKQAFGCSRVCTRDHFRLRLPHITRVQRTRARVTLFTELSVIIVQQATCSLLPNLLSNDLRAFRTQNTHLTTMLVIYLREERKNLKKKED